MSGEATTNSIILQSRLTASDTLTEGDLYGTHGVGKFEIDINPQFANPISTEWLTAMPENDFVLKDQSRPTEAWINLLLSAQIWQRLHFLDYQRNGNLQNASGS